MSGQELKIGSPGDVLDDDTTALPSSISKSSLFDLQMHSQSFQSSSTASSSSSIASSMTTVIHQQQQQLQQQVQQQMQVQLTALQLTKKQQPQPLLKNSPPVAGQSMPIGGSSSKPKFHSFLHQPEMAMTSTGQFLSTSTLSSSSQQQQKFVRQFVRSSSAHNDSVDKPSIKCIRSASQQMEDDAAPATVKENQLQYNQQQQQKMSVLISKSAETIDGASTSMTTTQMMGTGIRNSLTLSGGLLAPPNRKLTILSPIHAPPGLHDMLKRHGRSPCSPRIIFPGVGLCGQDMDMFG